MVASPGVIRRNLAESIVIFSSEVKVAAHKGEGERRAGERVKEPSDERATLHTGGSFGSVRGVGGSGRGNMIINSIRRGGRGSVKVRQGRGRRRKGTWGGSILVSLVSIASREVAGGKTESALRANKSEEKGAPVLHRGEGRWGGLKFVKEAVGDENGDASLLRSGMRPKGGELMAGEPWDE